MADRSSKAGNEAPFEEFVFEAWLRDGIKGFRSKFEPGRKFDASNFYTHIRNAQKEHLLAMRSLIDSAIDFIDKKEEKV